jgi:non-ribosomal peptide synthetase component E (peptide arylation enzyme)
LRDTDDKRKSLKIGRKELAAGLLEKGLLEGSPVLVMLLAFAVFALFVFSIVSQYLSERRRP